MRMNLDAISNRFPVDEACNRVITSKEECPWLVLGYNSLASEVFTLEVSRCGTKWNEMLAFLCPDKIQYVYLKLDAGIVDPSIPLKNKYVLVLITWLGERVGNNILSECKQHINKIRKIVPKFDCEMICKTVRDVLTHIENLQHTESFARYKSIRKCEIKPVVDQPPGNCFKLCVVGDSAIGKTCIFHRLVHHEYLQHFPTIGSDLAMLSKQYNGIRLKFGILDTPGNERYDSLMQVYLRKCKAIVLVYSIDTKASFDECRARFNPENLKQGTHFDVAMMLLGNKSDLDEHRQVSYQEGEELAKEFKIPLFFEVSAKTGANIEEAFGALFQLITMNCEENVEKGDVIKLGAPNEGARTQNSNCCHSRAQRK